MANPADFNSDWKRQIGRRGVNIVDIPKAEYEFMGSTFAPGMLNRNQDVSAEIQAVKRSAQNFMSRRGVSKNLQSPGIMRGIAAGNFYNTNPQYVLEQFLGDQGLRDGMTVFGFDIEALGGFQGGTTGGVFAPTEMAVRAYDFNRTNPVTYQKGSKKLKRYFNWRKDGTINLLMKLDDDSHRYFDNLIERIKNVHSVNQHIDISPDDMRSLRDILRYSGDAKLRHGAVIRHNTDLPAVGMITSARYGDLKEGLRRLQEHGLNQERFIEEVNSFINKNVKDKTDKAFKVMAYNGTKYDVPGLEYFFGDKLELVKGGKHARYTGNIDWYDTLNSLYANPLRRLYGDGYNVKSPDLKQSSIASQLFGYDVSKAHHGLYDIMMQEDIANMLMDDVENAYFKGGFRGRINQRTGRANERALDAMYPSKGKIPMAVYQPGYIDKGDILYARRGLGETKDSVFDTVFKLNRKTKTYEHLDYYTNSISAGKAYSIQGMFELPDTPQGTMHGMMLYNTDDDLYHMVIRKDRRQLENVVHERFVYQGRFSGNYDTSTGLLASYTDAARREYTSMFTPGMDHAPGYSFRKLKTYLDADEAVNKALQEGYIKMDDIAPDAGVVKRNAHRKVAEATGLTEAQARNYIYMRDRFSSEAPLLKDFASKLEGLTGNQADLALYNYKKELDNILSPHLESIAPRPGAEQMFLFDPQKNTYRLGNMGTVDELTSSLHMTIKQGRSSATYKNNAQQVVSDLQNRHFIGEKQAKALKRVVSQMDSTQVDDPRTMYFVREIADSVMKGKWDNPEETINRMTKEFEIANALEKGQRVAGGESPYFQNKVRGGVRANYLQESMKVRNFDNGVLDGLRESSADSAISKSKRVFSGHKLGDSGALTWDQEALNFFRDYDAHMKKRFRGISNIDQNIDFARNFDGIGSQLDRLAKAYMQGDPDAAAAAFLSKDKHSLVMAIYDKQTAAEITRRGGGVLDRHHINQLVDHENILKLHIPIANMQDDTLLVGGQRKMNPIFLRAKGAPGAGSWSDVYGEGLTERIIRHYRMGRDSIRGSLHQPDGINAANKQAKRFMDRAIETASGSGRLVNRFQENTIDATNNALMYLRGNYVHIGDLTRMYKEYSGKQFKDLYGDELTDFLRRVSRDTQEKGLSLTFKGGKGSAAISGILGSEAVERLVPFGVYGANTRDNYFQAQSYYNLGQYDLDIDPANRWRVEPSIMTKTQVSTYADELPGIKAKTAYMSDDIIYNKLKQAGRDVDQLSMPSVFDGTVLVSEDMKKYLNVRESKQITLPPGMDISDEMRVLLQQAESGETVYIQGLDRRAKPKITIGKSATGEVIEYADRQAARVLGKSIKEGTGETIVHLEQMLDAEDGMKLILGTDKGTVRFLDRETISLLGGEGTDIIAGAEFVKRQDWNNYIAGSLNLAIEEAKMANTSEAAIERAFKEHFDMDVRFQTVKRTIGKETIETRGLVIDDLVGKDSRSIPKFTGKGIEDFRESIGISRMSNKDVFTTIQETRVSRVSRYPRPYGGNVGPDEGVKYGLRELEMIRNRRITIAGKDYGTADNTYRWLSGRIHERAGSQFKSGTMQERIAGMGRVLDAAADTTKVAESDVLIRSRIGRAPIGNERLFDEMKPIISLEDMTRGDLGGTILDPNLRGKDSRGFWFETPFDFQIEGDSSVRNRLFMFQDDVQMEDGRLIASEMQQKQIAIEKWSRQFRAAKAGVGLDPEATQSMLLEASEKGQRAVNEYMRLTGKQLQGSRGMVADKMLAAKLESSAHFTLAGMNVFADEAWSATLDAVPANTSFISESFAKGMLRDSGLTTAQIDDIIDVMKSGEGIMAMTNRYPTFDEGSTLYGFTRISDQLSGDRAVMTLGDVTRLKGDYDGDHVSKVLAFADRLKGTDMRYSDLLSQSKGYYDDIVSGNMQLSDIQNTLLRDFTEFRMVAASDAEKSLTVGNFVKANYRLDMFSDAQIFNTDRIDAASAGRIPGVDAFDFGLKLSTPDRIHGQEFLSREARIMKQVGEASNLNAKMRRLAETIGNIEGTNISGTVGKAHADSIIGASMFNTMLPENIWERISTVYSVQEQSGIGAKHILPVLDKLDISPSDITPQLESRIYEDLSMFKRGLENLDTGLMRKAHEDFKNIGIKDILRLGAGDISHGDIHGSIESGLIIEGNEEQLTQFVDSFRFLGMDADNATQSLIDAVDEVGAFVDKSQVKTNPFLKYSLSEPSSAKAAIDNWRELSNWQSDNFIPTAEVKELYSLWGREEDFLKGEARFKEKALFRKRDTASRYLGMEGDNFARFSSTKRPIHTVGDDAIQRVASSFGGGGGAIGTGVMAGAAAFGALWVGSSMFSQGPKEESVDLPVADQAPSSDGKWVNPAVFGPAPKGAAPTARITPEGSGYENVNITINADDMHGWSEAQIRDIVQQQLSEQMPMDLNMNTTTKDNTQRVNRQWVNDTVARSIKFGYAF